jgi:aquaporin Z
MRALLTELIGTFFLVLVVGLATSGDAAFAPIAPLAIGMTLMVMVYAGANASGAHYNPAVSLGLVVTGALPRQRLLGYWGAQFLGAVAAGLLTWKFVGSPASVSPAEDASLLKALVGEAVGTFALVYVVAHTATGRGRAGNSYYGLAIGLTIAAMAFALGPITGGAFNPAVGFGSAIANVITGHGWEPAAWIYLVGPSAGGVVAAGVFKYQESGA